MKKKLLTDVKCRGGNFIFPDWLFGLITVSVGAGMFASRDWIEHGKMFSQNLRLGSVILLAALVVLISRLLYILYRDCGGGFHEGCSCHYGKDGPVYNHIGARERLERHIGHLK
jgi:hypothetical protein